ncbi:hypothetical protein VB779_19750 [Haloarculaceae archaeon H-GB11]|nr:hypothetical protein [Haloarculaceae archaeon H-GB11]
MFTAHGRWLLVGLACVVGLTGSVAAAPDDTLVTDSDIMVDGDVAVDKDTTMDHGETDDDGTGTVGVMPGDNVQIVRGDGKQFTPGETIVVPEQAADATDVRNSFLKAKKAFHEGRQDVQDIKKGDQEARDVPTFFGDEDEDEA